MRELKAIRGGDIHDLVKFGDGSDIYHEDTLYYLKNDVDAAISELKKKCYAEKSIGATFSENGAELARWVEELRKEIESLKASHYAEMVDAGMRERRLKRALYKACANWMTNRQVAMACYHLEARAKKFDKAIDKCRSMAERYK